MNERDNLLAMLSGGHPDHLPLDVWTTEPSLDMIERETGDRNPVSALGLCVERIGPRYAFESDRWRSAYEELGVVIGPRTVIGNMATLNEAPSAESVGAAYHLLEMRHSLEGVTSIGQLERLPWPDVDADEPYAKLAERVADAHLRGVAAIGQMDCTLFEMTWYVRGMDRLMLDLIDGNGIGDWLLDWFTQRAEKAVRAYVRAGVDLVWLGDDVGTQRGMMMAPDFWREHLSHRLKRVVDAVREEQARPIPIAYHSDGDVRPIVDDLIDMGIDILNPVQPECMHVDEMIHRYRDRLAFWGMVGTQTTMPFGTPDHVAAVVGHLRDAAADGVHIVLSPTHAIEPDVPWENLKQLVEEARRPIHSDVTP